MSVYFPVKDFIFKENIWKVMYFKEGCNDKITEKAFNQLDQLLFKYSKVFITRFDIRVCIETINNELMSKLIKKLRNQIKTKYKSLMGFIWVREQTGDCTTPHYHCAIYVNGHKVRNSFNLGKMIDRICDSLIYLSPFYPKYNGYMVKRNDNKSIQRVIYRISYFAKNESKGNRPRGISDYQVSRLKITDYQH
jgi:hypothetical protein